MLAQGEAGPSGGADRRILVISEVGCPPPHAGNRTRIAALFREMHAMGFIVHFAGVDLDTTEKQNTQACVDAWVWDFRTDRSRERRSLWQRARSRIRRWTLYRLGWVDHDVDERFADYWLEEARALQTKHRYARVLVPYVFHSKFLEAFGDPCLRIIDTIDVFSGRRERYAAHRIKDYWFSTSRAGERKGLSRASRIIAIQKQEARVFEDLMRNTRPVYIVGHFANEAERDHAISTAARIGFVGSNNASNIHGIAWFLQSVWPAVRASCADAELWIAGAVSDHVAPAAGVRVLGAVSDLESFYEACSVMVNPIMAGTGLKIKTIEALARGRPVVTTQCGAEGLEELIGAGLRVFEDAPGFTRGIVELLSDRRAAGIAGRAAQERVREGNEDNRRTLAQALNQDA